MSNSALVTYKRLSSHMSAPRTHVIDTVTIHCLVGQWTAKQGCDYFAGTTKDAAPNYVVGKDGSIGLSVEEVNRSHCSSNRENDDRSITIEVASDLGPPYAITGDAYVALVKLLVDICQRNNIPKLVWSTKKSDRVQHLNGCNMTVHRDYANKACPGDALYNAHGKIASDVNKALANNKTAMYTVQVGTYTNKLNAEAVLYKLKMAGFDGYITQK